MEPFKDFEKVRIVMIGMLGIIDSTKVEEGSEVSQVTDFKLYPNGIGLKKIP